MLDSRPLVSDMVLLPFIDFLLMKEGDVKDLGTLVKLFNRAVDALQQSSYSGTLFNDYLGALERHMSVHRMFVLRRMVEGVKLYEPPTTTS